MKDAPIYLSGKTIIEGENKMICFSVEINGERVCSAGIGEFGVLTTTLSWVRNRAQSSSDSEDAGAIALNVGGLTDSESAADEFVDWIKRRLIVGDEVNIKVIEAMTCDQASERTKRDPTERVEKAKDYYEELKAEKERG